MGGAGKTTISSLVFHDQEIQQHFIDGVMWLYVGPQIDDNELLMKQQTLLEWMGASKSKVGSRDMGRDQLRTLFGQKQCLVVLDDVWDMKWVHNLCNIPQESKSKVLMTTRMKKELDENGIESVEVGGTLKRRCPHTSHTDIRNTRNKQ